MINFIIFLIFLTSCGLDSKLFKKDKADSQETSEKQVEDGIGNQEDDAKKSEETTNPFCEQFGRDDTQFNCVATNDFAMFVLSENEEGNGFSFKIVLPEARETKTKILFSFSSSDDMEYENNYTINEKYGGAVLGEPNYIIIEENKDQAAILIDTIEDFSIGKGGNITITINEFDSKPTNIAISTFIDDDDKPFVPTDENLNLSGFYRGKTTNGTDVSVSANISHQPGTNVMTSIDVCTGCCIAFTEGTPPLLEKDGGLPGFEGFVKGKRSNAGTVCTPKFSTVSGRFFKSSEDESINLRLSSSMFRAELIPDP